MSEQKSSPTKPKRKRPSSTSRKDDILQAYNELLAEVEEMDKKETKTPEEKQKEELISEAETYTIENISRTIGELGNNLKSEAEKFTTLQKAIEVKKKELENLHQISATASTLKNLIYAQKRHETERAREEEEYRYNLELQRRKDQDEFEEEKKKRLNEFEGEIAGKKAELEAREETLSAAEKELKELRREVENFPEELANKVEATREEGYQSAQKEAEIKANLLAKEVESEKKLYEQKITSLEQTVKVQTTEIVSLKASLEKASGQLKDIAVKVIEGQSPLKPREAEEKPAKD
ncbi:MAG: hypothetical protein FJ044_00295 [Candidatus Cloacimonetes bacterium]|nr:hypothetical protein [Candidatus Cloacimonadota bacterium]